MAPLTPLELLRRLLDDNGAREVEESTAFAGQVEFFIAAPPMLLPPVVTVNGIVISESGNWSVPATLDEVIFAAAPGEGRTVGIRYAQQTWTNQELETYLEEANTEYVEARHVIYRAAILAIDTLMPGMALAFDFGEGAENFSFSSTFSRLMQLREMWEKWLEENAEEGRLYIQEMLFDSLEPGDIESDPAGNEFAVDGYFPDQPGSYGGFA